MTLVHLEVDITGTPNDNDVPQYDAATGKWAPAAVSGGGYTDEQAQDAVGTILLDTSTVNLTYVDGAPSISADVIEAGLLLQNIGGAVTASQLPSNQKAGCVGITIDGNGSEITTGVKGFITVPYSGTITRWDLVADQTGSIVIDVWKDTYANFPPTVADTIAGTEKPTLSSAQKNQDTTLSTWTTTVTAGDVIGFNVDSVSTVERVTLVIWITKT